MKLIYFERRVFLKAILSLTIILPMLLSVSFTSDRVIAQNAEHQSFLEDLSGFYESVGVDPTEKYISIGNPISVYISNDNQELEPTNVWFYPIFDRSCLELFAIVDRSTGNVSITQGLVGELAYLVNTSSSIALVYDEDSCYIYDCSSSQFVRLHSFSEPISGRSSLTDYIPETERVYTTTISTENAEIIALNALPEQTRTYPTIYLNTSVVLQPLGSPLCWAASTACVGNYLKGTNKNAVQVAQYIYGNTNYNYGGTIANCQTAMSGLFQYPYPVSSTLLTLIDTTIYTNLNTGHPLLASWSFNDTESGVTGYHMTVIYGHWHAGNTVYIMDPLCGNTTASKQYSSNYGYFSSNSGVYMTLHAYCGKHY